MKKQSPNWNHVFARTWLTDRSKYAVDIIITLYNDGKDHYQIIKTLKECGYEGPSYLSPYMIAFDLKDAGAASIVLDWDIYKSDEEIEQFNSFVEEVISENRA